MWRTVYASVAILLLGARADAAVFLGVDLLFGSTNTLQAASDFAADTPGALTDGLDGLFSPLNDGLFETSAGSRFEAVSGSIVRDDDDTPSVILDGPSLGWRGTGGRSVIWTLPAPSDAFGFFGFRNSGALVLIDRLDGSDPDSLVATQLANFLTSQSLGHTFFWGINDLATPVSRVRITLGASGITGPLSAAGNLEGFAYRSVAGAGGGTGSGGGGGGMLPVTAVPLPPSVLMLAAGLAVMGLYRTRRLG